MWILIIGIIGVCACLGVYFYFHRDTVRDPKIGDHRLIRQGDRLLIEAYEMCKYHNGWVNIATFNIPEGSTQERIDELTVRAHEKMQEYIEERKKRAERELYTRTRLEISYASLDHKKVTLGDLWRQWVAQWWN